MNILETIVAFKKKEIEGRKKIIPINKLEESVFYSREMPSFFDAIAKPGPSIIGEFKRKSPSQGMINIHSEVEQLAKEYEKAGISGMSILTDLEFFGGEDQDLKNVALFTQMPLLRKDFIIDEYQVIESKSIGASAILLIASILTKEKIKSFIELSSNIGLDVLFEIHDKEDLNKMNQAVRIAGINNRNLKTFEVDINHSAELFSQLPDVCLKVAESGIKDYTDVKRLYDIGFNGFLIGGSFMKSRNPGKTVVKFMEELKNYSNGLKN